MRKLALAVVILVALALLYTATRPKWSREYANSQRAQFNVVMRMAGYSPHDADAIATCAVDKAMRRYTEAEFRELDASDAGQYVGNRLGAECMCSEGIHAEFACKLVR